MEEVKKLLSPSIRRALQKKLAQVQQDKLVKTQDAELVDENKVNLPAVITKPKLLDLATSEEYLKKFIHLSPTQIVDFIDKQSDILMLLSKNAAIEKLAQAVQNDDHDAMEMYLKLVQASAVVAQEKIAVKKAIGIAEPDKPKQYVAEDVSPDEWEKKYKPGTPIQPSQEPVQVYIAPGNKTVN